MTNIIINGIIIVIKLGIKNNDKYIICNTSICIKFVKANNLVNCKSQDIDINIKIYHYLT